MSCFGWSQVFDWLSFRVLNFYITYDFYWACNLEDSFEVSESLAPTNAPSFSAPSVSPSSTIPSAMPTMTGMIMIMDVSKIVTEALATEETEALLEIIADGYGKFTFFFFSGYIKKQRIFF
jgi:hypothetical protein